MKTCSIDDRSGTRCQTYSSTRTRRSHDLGASASLRHRRIPSRSCSRFSWMRFTRFAAPTCSVSQASGQALIPNGWRAGFCAVCAHLSIAGDDSALACSQSTCRWSGVTPSRALCASALRTMQPTSPKQIDSANPGQASAFQSSASGPAWLASALGRSLRLNI